jgi:ribosomal-protein-alanine N-acetyltransferase
MTVALPPQPTVPAGPYLLRPFRPDDLDLVREASGDPYIPLVTTVPVPYSERAGLAYIQRQLRRPAQGAGYSFAVAEAVTDRAVGQIGVWLRDGAHGRADLGYWVATSSRGRGIAVHALRGLTAWTLSTLDVFRLELYVEPWNTASWRAAERCGYRREGLLRGRQLIGGRRRDLYVYGLLATDLPSASCPR